MAGNEALAALRGGHLDTVSFVLDYVEFRINYNVLRALASPVVEGIDGRRLRFPEPGSRDALCELIDTTVISAAEVDQRIEVRTDAGHVLTIPLSGDAGGPEFAHLVPSTAECSSGSDVQALEDITVVSLEQAVAAPLATRHLADLGARVIKVERPGIGDFARAYDHTVHGDCSYFVWLNRGKESLELDIKDAGDRALLDRLIDAADVFVQNLIPGAVTAARPRRRHAARPPPRADPLLDLRLRRRRAVPHEEGL